MQVIKVRNVREALPEGLRYLASVGEVMESRDGPVVVAPTPVTTVYERPRERVLLSAVRDANPFFHLMESFWMLAGHDNAAFLDEYVVDFSKRFAEPGGEIHDAYGRRWRSAFGFDQLDQVVRTLRADPNSRQCVVTMWDPTPTHEVTQNSHGVGDHPTNDEIIVGEDDLRGSWRTRPCNTHAYLRVRDSSLSMTQAELDTVGPERVLDLTICCRSNDVLMGAYGANAVHFSVLQEYLAARIGVGVGTLYQVSNNYHVYHRDASTISRRIEERLRAADPREQLDMVARHCTCRSHSTQEYENPPLMFGNADAVDHDIVAFVGGVDSLQKAHRPAHRPELMGFVCNNSWITDVAWRVARAHRMHRLKQHAEALAEAYAIPDRSWQRACVDWLDRRRRPEP